MQQRRKQQPQLLQVSSVTVTGHQIIAGSIDGCVRTYDLRAARCEVDVLDVPVACVSLSGDSNCLLAGCLDHTGGFLPRSLPSLLHFSGRCLQTMYFLAHPPPLASYR